MSIREAINYWVKSSEEDLKTAKSLFDSKRYAHCLFFPIHNLPRLSKDTGIMFSAEQALLLDEINEFNIRARYNDVKFRFYKKATPEFTKNYFNQAEKLYLWLKKRL